MSEVDVGKRCTRCGHLLADSGTDYCEACGEPTGRRITRPALIPNSNTTPQPERATQTSFPPKPSDPNASSSTTPRVDPPLYNTSKGESDSIAPAKPNIVRVRRQRYPSFEDSIQPFCRAVNPAPPRQPSQMVSTDVNSAALQTDVVRPGEQGSAIYAQTVSQPNVLEGTIISRTPLTSEAPDVDIARILVSILLIGDLIAFLGGIAIGLIIGFIVITAIAALFRLGCLVSIFSFITQTIFYVLSPLIQFIQQLAGRGGNTRSDALVPRTNYIIQDTAGNQSTFCVKGELAGAHIADSDRVRIRVRPWHGIYRFRSGVKLNTNTHEELSLPRNYSWVFLALLVAANIVGYIVMYGWPR